MAFLLLFAVRDGTNELLGKRLFFKPDLGWMVKCPKRDWLYPASIVPDIPLPESFHEYTRSTADRVVSARVSVPGCPRNALGRWVQGRTDVLAELSQRLAPEEGFTAVFPANSVRTGEDYQSRYDTCVERAEAVGSAWVAEEPGEVSRRLDGFACEVRALGSRLWPDLRSTACAALGSSVNDIAPWVESFMAMALDVECVGPLLQQAVQAGHPEAADWLVSALGQELRMGS
jgi:hypothetical protein